MAKKKEVQPKAQQEQPTPKHEKFRSAGAQKGQKILKEMDDTLHVYAKQKGGGDIYLFDSVDKPSAARRAAALGYHHTSLSFMNIKKLK